MNSEWVWTFTQHKNSSDWHVGHVPLSLHTNYTLNPASLQTACKSLIQNQSFALPGYPSLFLTILKRATDHEAIVSWSCTIHTSSVRFSKLHVTPHKMTSPYRHSLGTLSNLQKTGSIKSIFGLKTTQNRSFVHRPKDNTALWWWPLTSYSNPPWIRCDAYTK